MMVLANYVDDLATVLTKQFGPQVWKEIETKWKFDPSKPLEKFLGIVCKRVSERRYELEQQDLLSKVVKEYEEKTGRSLGTKKTLPTECPPLTTVEGKPLEEMASSDIVETVANLAKALLAAPGAAKPGSSERAEEAGAAQAPAVTGKKGKVLPPGESGTPVRSAVGGLYYAARGTRLELMKAVHELARRTTRWNPACTTFLEAVLTYCKNMKSVLVFDAEDMPKELDQWRVDVSSDARFACPWSTTGIVLCLTPVDAPNDRRLLKFLALDWTSQAQQLIKLSAAESEIVSAVHAMRAGLRFAGSWAMITGGSWEFASWGSDGEPRPCDVMYQRQDNTACITALKRGWSLLMCHVPQVYGVSLGWAAERIMEQRVRLEYENTSEMLADPLTKLTTNPVLYNAGILKVARFDAVEAGKP